MAFPTAVQITNGTRLLIQRSLPNRVLPVINVTTTAAVALNATTIPVTAIVAAVGLGSVVGDVIIQEGDVLTFNSTPTPTNVTVAANVLAGATTITVLPVAAALQSGNTATSNGYLQLLGVQDVSFKVPDKVVSTVSFETGVWTEEAKVRLGGEISVSGFFRKGDPAISQVFTPAANSLDLELAFRLVYPDLKFRSGFALLKNYEESGKLDAIQEFKATLMVNGAFVTG